ncbi:MAG: hypothetical protein AB9879_09885 [Methanothrix sp.]
MKPVLKRLVSSGIRSAVLAGTFAGTSPEGHAIFLDVQTPLGVEQHLWANLRALSRFPALCMGDRVRFTADLDLYLKRDGSESVRVLNCREAEVLP